MWIQQYFGGQPWYDPKEDFKDEEVSGSDKTNVRQSSPTKTSCTIRSAPNQSRAPCCKVCSWKTCVRCATKFIARHGKSFKDPWTQKYFASFDWYKANPGTATGQLSSIEKANLGVIQQL